jgi:hypothetical protein
MSFQNLKKNHHPFYLPNQDDLPQKTVFLLHCPLKVSNLARLIITDDIVDRRLGTCWVCNTCSDCTFLWSDTWADKRLDWILLLSEIWSDKILDTSSLPIVDISDWDSVSPTLSPKSVQFGKAYYYWWYCRQHNIFFSDIRNSFYSHFHWIS